jgi:pimeloyl-ACP methyl ester carboxylesterase
MVLPGRHQLCALAASVALLAGCAPIAPIVVANPRYATDSGARPQGKPATTAPPPSVPDIPAPKNDLAWHDCTNHVLGDAAVGPPPGVTLDCATYDADLDPINGATGTLSIGVVRARSADTPPDAGPLVMTTGSDRPSSAQLPIWLSHGGVDVLKSRPVVAVDRRGIGMSTALQCRDVTDRTTMIDQAQFEGGDDPVARLAAVSQNATTGCTDAIAPGDASYDNAHAAEDIERLRSTWDVPTVALLGVGNGAQVALAYAGQHPGKVARLVLDSPLPLAINAEAATEQRVKGAQAALDAFADQCVAINCPLAPDPKGAVDALLAGARSAHGPRGASVAAVTDAISTALAYPQGDRVSATNQLAAAIASARTGDTTAMTNLITQATAKRHTDGQFANSCSDALNRPTPDRVRELVVAWGKSYPQFGTVGALDLVKCFYWPGVQAPPDPKNLKIRVLLLGVQNDPIVGFDGVAAVSATVINAGTLSKRVMWQGTGHGASIYNPCALAPLISYVDSGNLPPTDTFCPA